MSFGTLKVEKGLCRCCFNDGSYTSLSDPCLELGQQEVYASMLQKYLGIDLSPVPGALCAATYKICEECIQRLSDACHFKKQVLECEKRFQQLYGKSVIQVVTNSTFEIQVKQETDHDQDVKPEDDDGDGDYGSSFQYDDIDDDDDDFEMNLDLQELKQAKKIKTEKVNTTVKSKPKPRPSKPVVKLTVKPTVKPTAKPAAKPAVKPTVKSKKEKDGDGGKKGDDAQRLYTTFEDGDSVKYQCNTCQRSYTKRDHFMQHYNHVHLKLRPKTRSCHVCSMKVPGHLRSLHMEEKHGLERPVCNACGKKFAYPFQVIKHQKTYHMNEKSFQCPECDYKCATNDRLSRHLLKHSPMRPHICEYCDKGFKYKKYLKTHIMIHLNERPHVCDICQEMFVQKSSLKYHMTKKHPEIA